jgi:hypothetical protein
VIEHRPSDADLREGRLVHARKHGDADEHRAGASQSGGRFAAGLRRCVHHRHAACGVHIDHPRTGLHRRLDGSSHRVWNVVELQVQEDAVAGSSESAYQSGAFEREQPIAHFHAAGHAPQRRRELQGPLAGVDVQRD